MKLDCIHQHALRFGRDTKRYYKVCLLKAGFMLKHWRCKKDDGDNCKKGMSLYKTKRKEAPDANP